MWYADICAPPPEADVGAGSNNDDENSSASDAAAPSSKAAKRARASVPIDPKVSADSQALWYAERKNLYDLFSANKLTYSEYLQGLAAIGVSPGSALL